MGVYESCRSFGERKCGSPLLPGSAFPTRRYHVPEGELVPQVAD